VTGRPVVISAGASDVAPMIASKPILMLRWTVGDCCSCRISFGASPNTRFSASRWNVLHPDAIFASIGERLRPQRRVAPAASTTRQDSPAPPTRSNISTTSASVTCPASSTRICHPSTSRPRRRPNCHPPRLTVNPRSINEPPEATPGVSFCRAPSLRHLACALDTCGSTGQINDSRFRRR
jgi:hypothetical protein